MSNSASPINSRLNKTRIDKWIFFFSMPLAMQKLDSIGIINKGNVDSKSVQFTVKKISIPPNIVKAISQRYGSGNVHISSHSREPFDLIKITFNISNDFANYITMFEWLNLLHDEKLAIPDPNDLLDERTEVSQYWANLGLIGLDEYNVARVQFTFTQAFPTELSGWEYDYTSTEEIECYTNFAFMQMHLTIPEPIVIES